MLERESILTCPLQQGAPCQDGHQLQELIAEGQPVPARVPLCRFYNVPLQRCDLVTLAAAWADFPHEAQQAMRGLGASAVGKGMLALLGKPGKTKRGQ